MISFHFKGTFESHEAEVARLWDLGCQGLEERGDELVAYFPEVFDLVAEGFEGRWQEDNTDWLAKYYADLKPIVLDKLIVAAEHCEVVAGEGGFCGSSPAWPSAPATTKPKWP
ncbi:MAG: hypothetical protein R2865_02295 [Deinococcales bacterium]